MNAKSKLLLYLSTFKGLKIISGGDDTLNNTAEKNLSRYIRLEINNINENYIDDLEFYFTPNDSTIQYRSMRREGIDLYGFYNKNRIENIRIKLNFLNIPVLRNRRRVLFFVESPFDTFGPPTIMFDKLIDNISGICHFILWLLLILLLVLLLLLSYYYCCTYFLFL